MSRDPVFDRQRPKSKILRRLFARYVDWAAWAGFLIVGVILAGLVASIFVMTENTASADSVELVFDSRAVSAPSDLVIKKFYAPPWTEVKKGSPIASYVDDPKEMKEILGCRAIRAAEPGQAKVKVLLAEVDGIVSWRQKDLQRLIPAREPLCEVLDPSKVVVNAQISGDSSKPIQQGQNASIENIRAERQGSPLVRYEVQMLEKSYRLAESNWLSGSDIKEAGRLIGSRAILSRDDTPLQFSAITKLEVDASGKGETDSRGRGSIAPPLGQVSLTAKAVEVVHRYSIQTNELPEEARAFISHKLTTAVRGRAVLLPGDGSIPLVLEAPKSLRLVAVLQGEGETKADESAIVGMGSALDRSASVRLLLDQPPLWLMELMKREMKAGGKVICKANIVTGQKPLAHLLLRRQ